MAVINEQIVTGRKFRKLIDEASRLWLRISFWTKACDVEFDDGETAETKFENMTKKIDDLIKVFQDGVNKIFNYLKGLGFTPSPNSPDGICNAIQNMYNKRYSDGRTQGQADVVANPGAYGVSTGIPAEQFVMYTSSRVFNPSTDDSLIAPHNGTCNLQWQCYLTYDSSSKANKCTITVSRNGTAILYRNIKDDGIDISPDSDDKHQFEWKKTLEIQNCTAGESLHLEIDHSGANISWIAGIY